MPRALTIPGGISTPVVNAVKRKVEPVKRTPRTQEERNNLATNLAADLFGIPIGGDTSGGGGGGGGGGRFKSLPFTLRDLALQREELVRQREAGLRDIGQEREISLEKAEYNALQRGIFRSGILTRNQSRVNREADEAAGDLKEQMRIALARLQNRENLAKAQDAHAAASGGGGGGGSGLQFTPGDIQSIFIDFFNLAEQGALDPKLASRVRGIEMVRRGFNDLYPVALDRDLRGQR